MIDTQDPFGQAEREFTLSSNSGHTEMKFTLLRRLAADDADAYLCTLEITGRNWREPFGQGEPQVVDDIGVHFHHILVSVPRLAELGNKLTAWLSLPADVEQELAFHTYHSLFFSLRPEEGIISSDEKPVARLGFAIGPLRGDYGFVVDQSCIRLFQAALDRAQGLALNSGRISEAWCKAAEDLGIDVVAPFSAELPDGSRRHFAALVKRFGTTEGTLINLISESFADTFDEEGGLAGEWVLLLAVESRLL